MTAPLLELMAVSVAFGGVRAVDDLSIDVRRTKCLALSAQTAPARRRFLML